MKFLLHMLVLSVRVWNYLAYGVLVWGFDDGSLGGHGLGLDHGPGWEVNWGPIMSLLISVGGVLWLFGDGIRVLGYQFIRIFIVNYRTLTAWRLSVVVEGLDNSTNGPRFSRESFYGLNWVSFWSHMVAWIGTRSWFFYDLDWDSVISHSITWNRSC